MDCAPNRESLSILVQPDMKLTKEFLKRIYAFDMDYPGFSEEAIAALESVGCVRAREHYTAWVQEYESKRDTELKEAAHWYRLECEKQWEKKQKGSEEQRTQKQQMQEQKSRAQQWKELSQLLGFQSTKTEK